MPSYAKLRTDLRSAVTEIEGKTVYNINDPKTGNYFRLREPEFWLINQFDGKTSYEEIAKKFVEKFKLNITAADVEQFVNVLEDQFFLEDSRSEQKLSRKSNLYDEKQSLFSRLLFIKIKAFKPGKFLDFLTKIYRPFHNPFWFFIQLILIAFGFVLLVSNFEYFAFNLYDIFNLASLLIVILAMFILVSFHEFAHAVICRYYGGKVNEIGFLLLYFQPAFFCDLSDAWLFKKKAHRLAVTIAGPYFQIVLLSLAVIIWRITIPGSSINELVRILVIVSWFTLIFNLNPLIKLDGYYILSDGLDIPNLRKKSFHYLSNLMKRKILGWPLEKIEVSSREKKIYLTYSILSLIYSSILILYILWIVAGFLIAKWGGIGLLLFLLVLFYTLRSNIKNFFKGIIRHFIYMKDIFKKPIRLATYVFILIILIVLFFFINFPYRVTGEVNIQPVAEFSLRLNDLGLMEKKLKRAGEISENQSSFLQMASSDLASLDLIPYVDDGYEVKKGETLAVLISNQVTKEIESAQSTLEKLKSDLALLKSPPKKEEIDEAVAEVNSSQAEYEQKLREEKRLQKLTDKKLVSLEQLETAQSLTQIAKADLDNKKAKLELLKAPPKPEEEAVIISEIEKQKAKLNYLINQKNAQSITTPISGTVIINHKNNKFLSVVDNHLVDIAIPVSDYDINLIRLKQKVKLKVRSYITKVFEGTVVRIPKDAIDSDGKAIFEVSSIFNNADGLLHKGMTGYAKIEVGKISLFKLLLRKITSVIRVEFWSWW